MAKAIKTAAVIVTGAAIIATGVGAAIAIGTAGVGLAGGAAAVTAALGGISATALGLAGAGLSALATALAQPQQQVTAAQSQRLAATIDPRAYRTTALGSTALPLDVRYEEWLGKDQEVLGRIIVHAAHRIESIDEIWLNDELAWTAAGGVRPKFVGYFLVNRVVLEGSSANTTSLGRWNGAHRLTGCAYTHVQFRVTGVNKKAESPFASGIPGRMTVVGKGAPVYDPRRDSTVPGGSGPMRADDQSTWRYVAEDGATLGENVALQILRIMLGWRILNPITGTWELSAGMGLPKKRINLASFLTAANLCDEAVPKVGGGSEPRYRAAGVVSDGEDYRTALNMFCAACCGQVTDDGGKLGLAIAHNDLAAAAIDEGLKDRDVMGGFTWDPDPSIEATPNVVRGRYTDASSSALYQLLPYPEVRIPAIGGIERPLTLDLAAVESPSQAQRIAAQALMRRQYDRRFTAPFDIVAWKYRVGDVLPFTFAPLGFTRKLFRVIEQERGPGGICNMTLRVEDPAIYPLQGDGTLAVQAAAPIVYDTRNSPIVRAIADAGETGNWSQIVDDDPDNHPRPADGATNSADPASPFGPDSTVGAMRSAVAQAHARLDTARADIEQAKDQFDVQGRVQAAQDLTLRQVDEASSRIGEALLSALLQARTTRARMRDAGMYVDPETGQVRIHGIEQQGERLSQAEFRLDGVDATINLKASVSYVNDYVDNKVAEILLDPESFGEFQEINLKITTAQLAIDGLNATVLTKADMVTVTSLAGVVSDVSSELNALAGTITSKAEKTAVDALGFRVAAAEQTLGALGEVGDVVGLVTSIMQARYDNAQNAETQLRDILAGRKARVGLRRQLATIQQELTTKIVDDVSAEAASRLLLAVEMAQSAASVAQQLQSLVTADSALAQTLTSLLAQLTTLNGTIDAEVSRLDTADVTEAGARAQAVSSLSAAIDSANGAIAGVQNALNAEVLELSEAIADEAGARASLASSVTGSLGSLSASITALNSVVITPAGDATATSMNLLDNQGRIMGTKATNTGQYSDYVVVADRFRLEDPDGGERAEYSNGNWRFYDASGDVCIQMGVNI